MKSVIASAAIAAIVSTSTLHAGSLSDPVIEKDLVATEAASSSTGTGASVALLLFLAAVMVAATTTESASVAVSDARLKTDITPLRMADNGLMLYQFRYRGLSQIHEGVMAQEVLHHTPDAVITLPGGYMAVDYARLGLTMHSVTSSTIR